MDDHFSQSGTDLEYRLLVGLMGQMGVSVSKHLLDEHFTLLWANDFYYDMIGYPKDDYETLFHNRPDLYYKQYPELWEALGQKVYEAIENKANGYELITKMPVNIIKHFHSSVIVTYVASEAFAAYTQISYLFLYIFKQFTVFCTINKNIIFFMIIFRSTFFSKSKCNSPANSS